MKRWIRLAVIAVLLPCWKVTAVSDAQQIENEANGNRVQASLQEREDTLQEHVDIELKERFLRAVAGIERKLDNINVHATTVVETTKKKRGSPPRTTVTRLEVAKRGTFKSRKVSDGENDFRITAINDKYAFEVKLVSEEPELKSLTQLGISATGDHLIESTLEERGFLQGVFASFYFGTPLTEFVKSKGFSITSMTSMKRENPDGNERVRIEFEYVPFPSTIRATDSYFICEPELGWAIAELGYTKHYPSGTVDTKVQKNTFGPIIGELLTVAQTTSTTTRHDGSYSSSRIITHEVLETEAPEEIFFLSHYGLPEPNFDSDRLRRRWIALVAVGLLLGAIAIYAKRRSAAVSGVYRKIDVMRKTIRSRRHRSYSLRTLMIFALLSAIVFSVLANRYVRLYKHKTAIAELEDLGAVLITRDPTAPARRPSDWRLTLVGRPTNYIVLVAIDSKLESDAVRSMIPHFRSLIQSGEVVGGAPINILIDDVVGGSRRLAAELQRELPEVQVWHSKTPMPRPKRE